MLIIACLCYFSQSGSSSPKDGPQISLQPKSPSIDRLVAESTASVPHPLLAGPAQQVARDTLGDLRGHLIKADRAPGLLNIVESVDIAIV